MNKRNLLLNEVKRIPEPLYDEILDFIHFLKVKIKKEKYEITMISESSLEKDWLKPEEDKAWKNL